MLKILLTVAVIAAVWFFLIKKPKVAEHRRKKAAEAQRPTPHKEKDEEIMVECEKCGTFVSSKEAIIVSGRFFCSKSCAGVKR